MAWLRHDLIMGPLADLPPTTRVLEIGAGQGAMAVRLARRFEYTGLEADQRSADVAAARLAACGTDAVLHAGRFEELPLDPPYDVVCAFEVLEHISDDIGALTSWWRLLAPGGRLVLSVPAWQARFGPTDERVGHFRRYDPADLLRALDQAGFSQVDATLYGFPLGYVLEAGRDLITRRRSSSMPADASHGTAESGRYLQPTSERSGAITDLLTRPFRALQRHVDSDRLGTGLVATARRPA